MKRKWLNYKDFIVSQGSFSFDVNPLDVNLAKMQQSLLEGFRREVSSQTTGYSARECYTLQDPVLHIKDVVIECIQSKRYSFEYSLWVTVTDIEQCRKEDKRLVLGNMDQINNYLDSPTFLSDCKGVVLYYDYVFKNFKSFQDYVEDVVWRVVDRVETEVPDVGNFDPVFEFFTNPSLKTKDDVGKYGLRVYKMRKDIVPDPSKRYVEAAAYDPSGSYKADMVVASGTKSEVLETMRKDEFLEKLFHAYSNLTELLHDA